MIEEITNNKEVRDLLEFDNHKAVFLLENKDIGFKGYISIHRKNPEVSSFGATRMWLYDNNTDGLKDSLRLSKMMSYKAALAGLNCGGAKGVIIAKPSMSNVTRELFLREYSKCVDLLKGQFTTGTDVGLKQEDLTIMKEETPYIVGFNDNAVEFTTLGIYNSIEVCLEKVFGTSDVSERSFAIQGVGKIGRNLIKLLWDKGCRNIYACDIDQKQIDAIISEFPEVKIVDLEEIYKQEVDVFSPCALGQVINNETINELHCKIIAGGANNQLANEDLGVQLLKKGILYAPDYVANAGGLISVFDEYTNKVYNKDIVVEKVAKIKDVLNTIFLKSEQEKKATNLVANALAQEIFNQFK